MRLFNAIGTATVIAVTPLFAGCWSPPKPDYPTREAALGHCLDEIDKAMKEVEAEKRLIKEKPWLFNSDHEDYYDNFKWTLLHTDKWTKTHVTQSYCKTARNIKWKSQGFVTGYIEWLETPKDGSVQETKVKKVYASYPTSYPWGSK